MNLLISPRNRKALWFTMIITSIVFSYIRLALFVPNPNLLHAILFFVFILFVQSWALIAPELFEMLFFKPLHPADKTKELEHKILILKEEIKRVNGEDFDDDIHFKFENK